MTRSRKLVAKRKRIAELERRTEDRTARVFQAISPNADYRTFSASECAKVAAIRVPPPEIIVDPSLGPDTTELVTAVAKSLKSCTARVNGIEVPLHDAYTLLLPILGLLAESPDDPRLPVVAKPGTDMAGCFQDTLRFAEASLYDTLDTVVAGYTTYDRKLLWYDAATVPGGRLRIALGARPAERRTVSIDGHPRPVFRCGGSWDKGGFRWVSWPHELLGTSDARGPAPVYIQQHALDRLAQRLEVDDLVLHGSLLKSLADPVLTRRNQDTVFVGFRLLGRCHVGHLVVRSTPVGAVVTTFLVLTMQGTPEADRLRQELKLRGPDIEYTGLDQISTLMFSDLALDPELAPLFGSCGCADLLKLRHKNEARNTTGLSAALRDYLGFAGHGRPPQSPRA